MKRQWLSEELAEHFTLHPGELAFIRQERRLPDFQLILAALLKFFQYEIRFPNNKLEIPGGVLDFLANQLESEVSILQDFDWSGRTIKRYRVAIRDFLGFRTFAVDDSRALLEWLLSQIDGQDLHYENLRLKFISRCRVLKLEIPSAGRMERIIKSAIRRYQDQLCQKIAGKLSDRARQRLDELIVVNDENDLSNFSFIQQDSGKVTVNTVGKELEKLAILKQLALPEKLFEGISKKILEQYRQRVIAEPLREIRRHPPAIRYTLLAAYCWRRKRQIIDTLTQLVIDLATRMERSAGKRVDEKYLKEIKKVRDKGLLLYQMAEAALERPDDTVRQVIFPVVNENTLGNVIREFRASGGYAKEVQRKVRSSYSHHYRRLILSIIEALEFNTNSNQYQQLIEAVELIQRYIGSRAKNYEPQEEIPIEGVIPDKLQDQIVNYTGQGEERINRINYEIGAIKTVKEHLRSKSLWIKGAEKFGDPDKDVPPDFDQRREQYYARLKQPTDARQFTESIKRQMKEALLMLDKGMPKNGAVKILKTQGGRIKLSPLTSLPDPPNIAALKSELNRKWRMISLLDVLKETDMRVNFTPVFSSSASREHLSRSEIQKRLLLGLYGLGTNTGLKRMSGADPRITYNDLLYIKRRFLRPDSVRQAIVKVSNAIFKARTPYIWGENTTACASDAKKFGAWDQNLMTEWHARYRGPGIMIYWHVEKNSACIYSQLKRPSSSEVAAMIHGLLHHETDMEVKKNYVDTHGQSTVAFAFCYLLGFELLPRLKNLPRQKLSRPESTALDQYPNLQPILTRPIRWDIIEKHYDDMIKYAAALLLGTADTETILRRFKKGSGHPLFRALSELGKAIKTIFLCNYLHREELCREIHEGLQVIENWNSANDFIFFGNGREITSNQLNAQELSMLSLHLLQISLVYINTLMIEQLLSEPLWLNRLTDRDKKALSPLIYAHINPYGSFRLDMDKRLLIRLHQ